MTPAVVGKGKFNSYFILLLSDTDFMFSYPLVPALLAPTRVCPSGWTKLSTGCYLYKEDPMTWAESKAFCEDLGAKMVVVESKLEKEEITNMVAEATAKRVRFWVGVKKVGNSWKSADGVTTPAYAPWGAGCSGCTGGCVRSGPSSGWYKARCAAKGDVGHTFNPFCKK